MVVKVLIEIELETGKTLTHFPMGVKASMVGDVLDTIADNLYDNMYAAALQKNPGASQESLNKAMDSLNMEDVLEVMEPYEENLPPDPEPSKPKQRRSRITRKK